MSVQFLRFLIVGVINTTISFIVFAALFNIGLIAFFSQAFSYLSGVAISYFLNSKFTFNDRASKTGFMQFFLVQMVMLFLSSTFVFLGVDLLGFQYVIVWIFVMAIITVLNFFSSKYFVFEKDL